MTFSIRSADATNWLPGHRDQTDLEVVTRTYPGWLEDQREDGTCSPRETKPEIGSHEPKKTAAPMRSSTAEALPERPASIV